MTLTETMSALYNCSGSIGGSCEKCPYNRVLNCNTQKDIDALQFLRAYQNKYGAIDAES